MRKILGLGLGILVIILFQGQAPAAEMSKIGVVDIQKFQQKSTSFQRTRAGMKKKFDGLQQKLDQEKAELIKLEEDLKKQGMMLSLDAQEDKKLELDRKRRHFKYLYEDFTQEMKAAEAETTRKIGLALEKIVQKIGKQEGYTLIFEKRALGLLYFDNAVDITDRVVDAYDKGEK